MRLVVVAMVVMGERAGGVHGGGCHGGYVRGRAAGCRRASLQSLMLIGGQRDELGPLAMGPGESDPVSAWP